MMYMVCIMKEKREELRIINMRETVSSEMPWRERERERVRDSLLATCTLACYYNLFRAASCPRLLHQPSATD